MTLKILIIIPCYNEQVSLPILLQEINTLSLPTEYELDKIIINDCSKDKTSEVAKANGAKVLDLTCNLGIGGAVQTGIKYAIKHNFDFAVQMDGDGQHPPSELIKLLEHQKLTQADVVIGSRFIDKKGFQSSFIRRMGIRYFYGLNRLFTQKSIYDSTSGFRLLARKALNLAAINYPDDYPEPESLVIFSKANLSIKEVPVTMRGRLGGKSSIGSGASVFYGFKVSLAMLFSFIRN
ncbi:glycosyl transferase family 2 [Pedobacter psychrotolerans]|uniref:Glycosyl transferase n=1 Tax=Pedobacter psychrotolerans TaxID=1843235 RepID=A0A4R2H5Y5_9SPHI|nr:glycosyltransferase family 2 protein [Pedobacter psychrotolerans]TCO21440.1 glycosyl transferase family 2 [Pedobacter psychrotolerans]GGE38673.1 putative glycosyl transferase [Pedobacter psychrotolerans]